MSSKLPKINDQITTSEVRLIDSDGTMVGIVGVREALSRAREQELDLVEISPTASPPVCKILSFAKFKYEEKKKAVESRKKQRTFDIKEVKIRPSIGINDLMVKIRQIRNFIENGDQVKVNLIHKGREIIHKERNRGLFNKVIESVSDIAKPESEPKFVGNILNMKIVSNVKPQQ